MSVFIHGIEKSAEGFHLMRFSALLVILFDEIAPKKFSILISFPDAKRKERKI